MKTNIFNFFIYNGLPNNAELKERSQTIVLNSISFISVILLVTFSTIDIFEEKYILSIFTGFTAITITASIIIVGLTKKLIIGKAFVSYIAFVLFSALVYIADESKSTYFWIYMFPLVSIFFLGLIHGAILTLLFGIIITIIIYLLPPYNGIPVLMVIGPRTIGSYIGVSGFTIAFELVRVQAFNQLELTAADLTAKRKQTKMILNTVKQGIFLLDENLNLEDERSQFFDTLFVNVRDNHSFLELIKNKLPQRDFVATKDYLELFFNETVNPTLLSSINPIDKILMTFTGDKGEITYTWLEFEFERILLKNGSVQILGLFKDVTERVLLEEKLLLEENESSKNMENLFQVIHVNPELMNEFLKDSEDEINKINELLRVETKDTASVINHIFTIVHSIKGNALLLGLNNIATKLQEFEEYIKELKVTDPTWRELLKLTVNLAELKHDIYGIKELIGKIMTFQKKVGGKANNSKFILEETLRKFINKLSLEYDKSIDLNIEGYDINLIPEKYRRLFKDTINQFIRNSVAHGLEHSDERVTLKKGPVGTISISLKKHGDNLEFIFRDDGSGLSIKKLKASAIKNKGFSQDQMKNMKNADIVKLIFHPGFSTANSVNEIAGQGVGMSVIKNHVESAGGKLSIKSSTGKFCEFKILLPV